MKIISTFSVEQIKQVHQMYKQVWWANNRSYDDTESCIEGSQVCIGITDTNGDLVGFTRVVTDFIFKAIIFDVIVVEPYRGSGLGKELVTLVRNHEKLQKVKHFELYCLPEMEEFYSNLGFSSDVGGIQLMRRTNA